MALPVWRDAYQSLFFVAHILSCFLIFTTSLFPLTSRFQFACHLTERSEEVVFGTGGQILAMFKQVMGVFAMLHTLELRDLLLEGCEGLHLLDDVRMM